jgi:putative transposase
MSVCKVGVLLDMLRPLLIRYRFSCRDPSARAAQSPGEAKTRPLFLPGCGRPDLGQSLQCETFGLLSIDDCLLNIRRGEGEPKKLTHLREGEAGAKAGDLARKHGISDGRFNNWKAKFHGMDIRGVGSAPP